MRNEQTLKEKGNQPHAPQKRFDFGAALAIGVSLGMILGLLMDNTSLGLVTGLNLAVLANALEERRRREPGADAALVISVAGLIFVAALWIFW